MSNINDIRKKIDDIDNDLLKLFVERMDCSKNVAEYKKENNIPIFDKQREEEIKSKLLEKITDENIKKYYILFLDNLIDISKKYQREKLQNIKVGYAGKKGAFAYFAIKKLFGECETIGFKDFKSAYYAVKNGEVEYSVLPIENSDAGEIGTTLDLIFESDLYITDIYEMPIDQALLGIKGTSIENIKTIYSHMKAISQSMDFINSRNIKYIETDSTSDACEIIKEKNDKTIGCIANCMCADIYDLEVLKDRVNGMRNNTTRFAVFSRILPKRECKNFIITFTVKNEAGSLAKALSIISSYDYNMRCIRSRLRKDIMWNYYFYAELSGNVFSTNGEIMLKALKTCCDDLKVVGVYNDN